MQWRNHTHTLCQEQMGSVPGPHLVSRSEPDDAPRHKNTSLGIHKAHSLIARHCKLLSRVDRSSKLVYHLRIPCLHLSSRGQCPGHHWAFVSSCGFVDHRADHRAAREWTDPISKHAHRPNLDVWDAVRWDDVSCQPILLHQTPPIDSFFFLHSLRSKAWPARGQGFFL